MQQTTDLPHKLQVGICFLVLFRVQLLNIHEYVRIYISKNGHPLTDLNSAFTTQLQTNNDELIGGVYLGPTVMHQLNGSTDYVEVFFYTDEPNSGYCDSRKCTTFFL